MSNSGRVQKHVINSDSVSLPNQETTWENRKLMTSEQGDVSLISKKNNDLLDKVLGKVRLATKKSPNTNNVSEGEDIEGPYTGPKEETDILAKRNIYEKLAALDGSKISSCTEVQKDIILKYGASMLENCYKESYVLEVCNSMAVLYTMEIGGHTVEDLLPKRLIFDDDVLLNRESTAQRAAFSSHLTEIMSANGGDYKIMEKYLKHQGMHSNVGSTLSMRGFFLDQLTDVNEGKYYLLEGDAASLKSRLCSEYPDQERYKKTVAMYQAFVGIALNHIENIPGVDRKAGKLTVYRATSKYTPGGPQGVLDSASLQGICYRYQYDSNIFLKIEVPFCDVRALYFLSPELCCDFWSDPTQGQIDEHEAICRFVRGYFTVMDPSEVLDQEEQDFDEPLETIMEHSEES